VWPAPKRARSLIAAWVIAGGVASPASAFAGSPGAPAPLTSELLKPLELARYPSDTRAPEFRGRTLEGETMTLAGLRGRVVLLNFWASWCLDCRPEMPMFEQLHQDFAGHGLAVLGINLRETPEVVRRYRKGLNLTFPVLLDQDGKIGARYGVIGMPTTFVIGRDGRAVALAIGPRAWTSANARAIIGALLAEPGNLRETR